MSRSKQHEQKVDRNELDSQSYQIASFFTCIILNIIFLVSDYEVLQLRIAYNRFLDSSSNEPTTLSIAKRCSFSNLPLFIHINDLRDKKPYSWNSFFQFISFIALAPTASTLFFCMCMVLDLTDDNSNITLEDIRKYCEYLNTADLFDEEMSKKIFNEIDNNNDGFLSISQFITFVSKTNELWMPICEFRLSLINHFFPHNLAINILQRRAQIYVIREYKITHNGAYPDRSCVEQIMEILFGFPNKYKFDYDPNENISIYDITRMMIMKYKKDAVLINNSHKLLCAKKQIGKVIDSPKIKQLDQIYAAFGYNPTKQCTGGNTGDDESRNNSRTSLSQQTVGLNKRPHSILKHTSSYSQMHSTKSVRGCGRRSCGDYSFDNRKRLSKNLRTYKSANQSPERISPKSPATQFDIPGYITQEVI